MGLQNHSNVHYSWTLKCFYICKMRIWYLLSKFGQNPNQTMDNLACSYLFPSLLTIMPKLIEIYRWVFWHSMFPAILVFLYLVFCLLWRLSLQLNRGVPILQGKEREDGHSWERQPAIWPDTIMASHVSTFNFTSQVLVILRLHWNIHRKVATSLMHSC